MNPLIHLSQFDLSSVLTSVKGKAMNIQGTWILPISFSLFVKHLLLNILSTIAHGGNNDGDPVQEFFFLSPIVSSIYFPYRSYRFLFLIVTVVSQWNYGEKNLTRKKEEHDCVSGSISDGLTQTVMVNSIPLRPLKHEAKDIDRKSLKRD